MIRDVQQLRSDRLLTQLPIVFPIAAATASAGTALAAGLTGLFVSVAAVSAAAWYAKKVRGRLRQAVPPGALLLFLGVLFSALLTGLLRATVASVVPFSTPAILLSALFLFLHLGSRIPAPETATGTTLLRLVFAAGLLTVLLVAVGLIREILFNGTLFAAQLDTDPVAEAFRSVIGWMVAGLVLALWRGVFRERKKEGADHAAV